MSAPISVTPGDMLTWFCAAVNDANSAKGTPEKSLPIACVLHLLMWRRTPSHKRAFKNAAIITKLQENTWAELHSQREMHGVWRKLYEKQCFRCIRYMISGYNCELTAQSAIDEFDRVGRRFDTPRRRSCDACRRQISWRNGAGLDISTGHATALIGIAVDHNTILFLTTRANSTGNKAWPLIGVRRRIRHTHVAFIMT